MSGGIKCIPGELIEWLTTHDDIVDFVRVGSEDLEPEQCAESNAELVEKLNRALLSEIERQAPVMAPPKRRPKHFSGKAALAFNQRYFISVEIQRIRKEQLDLLSQRVADIVNLLTSKYMSNVTLDIDDERLVKETVCDSREIVSLTSLSESLSAVIEKYESELATEETQRCLIVEVLDVVSQIYEDDISFLLSSPMQDKFEKLFEYDGFPLSQQLNEVVMKGYDSEFTRNIVRLVYRTLNYFSLPKQYDTILCTMLFRYAYDKLYGCGLSPLTLTKVTREEIDTVSRYLKSVQFKTIEPPDKYCPPHSPDDAISEVFDKSGQYGNAVRSLDRMEFQTNPFDALYWVQDAIHGIEHTVADTGECDDVMLPFEDTFSLFLCITAAADVPDLLVYVDFVQQCIPGVGLNAYFDFARTKLVAAIAHLKKVTKVVTS